MLSILRSIFMYFMANKYKSVKAVWLNAGPTKRIVVQGWALVYLLRYGSTVVGGDVGIFENDIFPHGLDASTPDEVAQVQGRLGEWLDYWGMKHPTASLRTLMEELIARLVMAKRGWFIDFPNVQFPFDEVIVGVRSEEFEQELVRMSKESAS